MVAMIGCRIETVSVGTDPEGTESGVLKIDERMDVGFAATREELMELSSEL